MTEDGGNYGLELYTHSDSTGHQLWFLTLDGLIFIVDTRNPTHFTTSLACQLIQKAQNREECKGTRGISSGYSGWADTEHRQRRDFLVDRGICSPGLLAHRGFKVFCERQA